MNRHVYWAVRCRTYGCGEWLFLCHLGIFERNKTYNYAAPGGFEVECPTCRRTHSYGREDVTAQAAAAPDPDWVNHPFFTSHLAA